MSTPSAAPSNSKVQLTLMCLFRQSEVGEQTRVSPFVGSQQVWMADGRIHLVADSVPFHDRSMDMLAPRAGKGMLALFGIRDALSELQHWRTTARSSQARFTYLQMQVDVGTVHNGVVTRASLQEHKAGLRFINVKRCAAEMQKQWLARFAQWVREEGSDPARDMAHVRQMAARPDLFERLLWEDEDLRFVDVMVLPLTDWPASTRTRQVAYVRAGAPVRNLVQGSDQVQVHLPEWMQAKAER